MDIRNILKTSDYKLEIPNNDLILKELKDPEEATKNILYFLKSQSAIANRQFKTSRNLIIATILMMFLQIIISAVSINQTKEKNNTQERLTEMQLKQSKVISHMTLDLLDLQNQIKNLEDKNDSLLNILK